MLLVLDQQILQLIPYFGQLLELHLLLTADHLLHTFKVFLLDHHLEVFGVPLLR
jgi:hypothetical protein